MQKVQVVCLRINYALKIGINDTGECISCVVYLSNVCWCVCRRQSTVGRSNAAGRSSLTSTWSKMKLKNRAQMHQVQNIWGKRTDSQTSPQRFCSRTQREPVDERGLNQEMDDDLDFLLMGRPSGSAGVLVRRQSIALRKFLRETSAL